MQMTGTPEQRLQRGCGTPSQFNGRMHLPDAMWSEVQTW